MLVKMITTAAGPDFNAQPGEDKVVADDLGQALIDAGHAELVCEVWTPPAEDEPAPAAAAPAPRRRKATAKPRETR